MKKFTYRKLKGRIVEKYGTLTAFANALGLSKQSLSKKMNNKTGFSQADIEKWSSMLDIVPDDYGSFYFS